MIERLLSVHRLLSNAYYYITLEKQRQREREWLLYFCYTTDLIMIFSVICVSNESITTNEKRR